MSKLIENPKTYSGRELETIFFRPMLTGPDALDLGIKVMYNMPVPTTLNFWRRSGDVLQKFKTNGWSGGSLDPAVVKDKAQAAMAAITNPEQTGGTLAEKLVGADVFIGTSAANLVTTEMVKTMNRDAIIFACANPNPEILPDAAKAGGAKVISTGRSDFPNQINNVLAFPGVFRGTFDVRASDINEEMKMAAAQALADLITDEELKEDYIIPGAFDKRVAPAVANAVMECAKAQGVARV